MKYESGITPLYCDARFIVMISLMFTCLFCSWYYTNLYDNTIVRYSDYISDNYMVDRNGYMIRIIDNHAYTMALQIKSYYVPMAIISLFVGIAVLTFNVKMVFDYLNFQDSTETIEYEIPKRVIIKKIYKGIPRNSRRKSIEIPNPQNITSLIANTKDMIHDERKDHPKTR